MAFDVVVFDLDGTLVDSAPGILAALRDALHVNGVTALVPLDVSLIGPPLPALITEVAGPLDAATLSCISAAFKNAYDNSGYLQTRVYPGIEALLAGLREHDKRIFIATNKRRVPTQRIIHHLGWAGWFEGVHSLDDLAMQGATKADLIRHILKTHNLRRNRTVYVGDREEDAQAAHDARLAFMHAAWGYAPSMEPPLQPAKE